MVSSHSSPRARVVVVSHKSVLYTPSWLLLENRQGVFVVMLYCKGNTISRLPIVETDSLQLPFSVIMKIIHTLL